MTREFLGFAVVGIVAGGINIAARYLIDYFTSYEAAVALAFPIALTVAFALNRNYVFKSEKPQTASQFLRFAIVNLSALFQVWVISVGLVRYVFPAIGFVWHPELIGHSIGVASPVLTSFLFYKYWIFKKA